MNNMRGRTTVWPPVALLCALLWLLLAATVSAAEPPKVTKGADIWREVNHGKAGYTTVAQPEGGVLINRSGEAWRIVRDDKVKPYGAWWLTGVLGALVLVFLVFGRNRLREGRSGRRVKRWSLADRILHWSVAGLFIVLALTGLSILYAKHFLPELLGGAFGGYMQLAKWLHNFLGPVFGIALLLMVLKWIGHNIFNGTDLRWLFRLGGLLGGHPPAGFTNGAEKIWYWVVFFGGLVVIGSGLVLDFPIFGQLRETMQDANLIHAGVSLLLIGGVLAHAYIGSVGTEGALEGMLHGEVDENWARQHHSLWYEETRRRKP